MLVLMDNQVSEIDIRVDWVKECSHIELLEPWLELNKKNSNPVDLQVEAEFSQDIQEFFPEVYLVHQKV